jgi:hypothetical protein
MIVGENLRNQPLERQKGVDFTPSGMLRQNSHTAGIDQAHWDGQKGNAWKDREIRSDPFLLIVRAKLI